MYVRGLHEFWERRLGFRPTPIAEQIAERMLLDALGLGIEQTSAFIGARRPDFAAFTRWIETTAGPLQAERIARYHAALDGTPPPPETAERLAAIDAMPDVLDAADLLHWHAHGYVILHDAISAREVADAAALLWTAAQADPDNPATWHGDRPQGLMVQIFQHPALEAARRSPRIHKAFAQLWATSDLWSTTDRMSFNPPVRDNAPFRSPRLHWDVSLATPIPFATQGILYLADTAEDQGALELVPGFHHRIESWLASLGHADPRQVDLSAEAIRIAGRAGDLIIWRQDLPHGASPNRTETPRLAQYVNMYSAALELHPDWR